MVHVSPSDYGLAGASASAEQLEAYLSSESDTDFDVEDAELYADIEPPIPLDTSFANVVLISGLPIAGPEKYAKLCDAVHKKVEVELTAREVIAAGGEGGADGDGGEGGDEAPFTVDVLQNADSGETVGIAFVTFASTEVARAAARCLGQTGLGSKHPFQVCLLDDFERTLRPDAEAAEPKPLGHEKDCLRDWTRDPLGREQYAFRVGRNVGLNWHDPLKRQPDSAVPAGEPLGRGFVWSPMGSYLVTFHRMGLTVRGAKRTAGAAAGGAADGGAADGGAAGGGPASGGSVRPFAVLYKLEHAETKAILFSPDERYLISWDGTPARSKKDSSIIIWDVLTGKKMRMFRTPQYNCAGARTDSGGAWPFFVFSHDGNYLAMRRERDVVVFELPGLTVLEDNGVRAPLTYPLEFFQWAPAANLLSIWCPEVGEIPGRLHLVDIPSRTERAMKNVFNVRYAAMHWQPRGDFLALVTVLIRKKGKRLRQEVTQLEIFRIRQRSVPVDTVTIENGRVKQLVWERGPLATRFATIEADGDGAHAIKFYVVQPAGSFKEDTELVATLPISPAVNRFEWSPVGQYFVAAAANSGEGTLIFGSLAADSHKLEVSARDEHTDLTDLFWDPSGRYVTTAVLLAAGADSAYRYTASAGWRIYSFLGRLQHAAQNPEAAAFAWRPRPPTLLPQAKIEEVQKKLKEYSKQFDLMDDERRAAAKAQLSAEAAEKEAAFWSKVNGAREKLAQHPRHAEWTRLRQKLNEMMEWEETVEETEEFLESWTAPFNATSAAAPAS